MRYTALAMQPGGKRLTGRDIETQMLILRAAVTGQTVGLPLLESMEIIGRETVLARIQKAVEILEAGQ